MKNLILNVVLASVVTLGLYCWLGYQYHEWMTYTDRIVIYGINLMIMEKL
jgi:hypothetical protein